MTHLHRLRFLFPFPNNRLTNPSVCRVAKNTPLWGASHFPETGNCFFDLFFVVVVNDTVAIIVSAVEEQNRTTREIAENISQATLGIQEVTENVGQSPIVADEVARDISTVSSNSTEVAGHSGEMTNNALRLRELAKKLRQLISEFRT